MAQANLGYTTTNVVCLSLTQLHAAYDAICAAAAAMLAVRNEPRTKSATDALLFEEEERMERVLEAIVATVRKIDPDQEGAALRRRLLMKHAVRVDDPELEREIVRSFMWDPQWVAAKLKATGYVASNARKAA
jgi:hypothetical protein